MKIFTAVLIFALTVVPGLAASYSGPIAAPRAEISAREGALVAFSGQGDATGQPDVSGRNGEGRNGTSGSGGRRDESSGRSDRVIIKGKGGKVTGVERKPGPGGERGTGSPPRQ